MLRSHSVARLWIYTTGAASATLHSAGCGRRLEGIEFVEVGAAHRTAKRGRPLVALSRQSPDHDGHQRTIARGYVFLDEDVEYNI